MHLRALRFSTKSFASFRFPIAASAMLAAVACGASQASDTPFTGTDSPRGTGADGGSSRGAGNGSGGSSSGAPSTGESSGGAGDPGSGSETSDDASSDASTSPTEAGQGESAVACPKTITKPSQLVFLGDSYLNWGEAVGWDTIVPRIETHLQTVGSAAYSASPRRYDVAGANMSQIVTQYTTAHTADADIDTIVMDGGGNDILLGDRSCLTNPPTDPTTTCAKTIDTTLAEGKTVLTQMQADGVKHVVFFFYPHVDTVDASGNAIGISGKYANDTLDYAYPKIQAVCAAIPNCVFVDTRPAWGDNYAMYIDPQGFGVHPNNMGSQLLVDDAIWPAMLGGCIAQ
jgi:hypothetical protein